MEPDSTPSPLRVLAEQMDCFTEDEVCTLYDVVPNTTEAWRKRGKGPAYILAGRNYLYPRQAVKEHLYSKVRERKPATAAIL